MIPSFLGWEYPPFQSTLIKTKIKPSSNWLLYILGPRGKALKLVIEPEFIMPHTLRYSITAKNILSSIH